MSDPPRILLLLPFAPSFESAHGGGRVIAELVSGLAARHRLAVLCLHQEDEPPADEELRARCEILEEFPQPPLPRTAAGLARRRVRLAAALAGGRPMWVADTDDERLRARASQLAGSWKPDVVQAEFHVMAQYLDATGPSGAVTVVTEHEVGAAAAADLAARLRGPARLLFGVDASAWRRYERRVLARADRVVVFSGEDADRLRALVGVAATAVPLGTRIPPRPLSAEGTERGSLLFVGNFMHPPNVEAARILAEEVLPRVRARLPGARLYLVGPNPPPALRRAAGGGVEVTGRVEEVAPYLDRAEVVVLPIRSGGGVRVKLLEALAAGKPVVASRRAVQGVAVRDGQDVLIADGPAETAERVLQALGDAALRARLGAGARALAERELSWERTIDGYERLYDELARAGADRGP